METSGYDSNDKTKLILELIRKNKGIPRKQLVQILVDGKPQRMSLPTFNRYIRQLRNRGMIQTERDGVEAKYYLETDRGVPRIGSPSGSDRLLLKEAEDLVSDLIRSELLVMTVGENLVVTNEVLKEFDKDDAHKLATMTLQRPSNRWLLEAELTPKMMEENKSRIIERAHLHRRCSALYHSLVWLEKRRRLKFYRPMFDDRAWSEHVKIASLCPDAPGSELYPLDPWLEFYLGVIDVLSRKQPSLKGKGPTKESAERKRPGRHPKGS